VHMKETLRCFCENEIEFEYADSVDLTEEVINSILAGEFMSVQCSACKRTLKPEFPVFLKSNEKKYSIYLVPENQRNHYIAGKYSVKTDASRIVIGYRELVEKIKIFEKELDDRVIESIKYYFLEKTDVDDVKIRIFLQDVREKDFVFHIHGLKKDEIGITKTNRLLYEKIAGDIEAKIKEKPYSLFLTPPYVSVQNITFEG